MECLEKKLIYWCHMYMERTSQDGFPVIKNNAISNCNNITSHSQQANSRFYTHLSIGDVTRYDSQRRFFCATQHHNTVLRHCFEWLQLCSNMATLCWAQNRRGESSRVTSPLGVLGVYQSVVSLIKTFHGAWLRVVCIESAKCERESATKPFQGRYQSVFNFLIITVAMESLQEFLLISFAVVWLLLEIQESRVKRILPVSDWKVWELVCFCDNHTRHRWVNLVKDKKKEIWLNY